MRIHEIRIIFQKRNLFVLCLIFALAFFRPAPAFCQTPEAKAFPDNPKLILQITVDQLRGDEPFLYQQRFGQGGFRLLLDRGKWYTAAHHPHSHTETVVGHTTIATGAFPSRHGMIGNSWYNRETQQIESSVESDQYPLVGTTEIGAAPVNILTTTFSDELVIATSGQAKVFSVSVKDRAAVAMAGHSGKAFWFDSSNGEFVTSTYYYKAYPAWVSQWNSHKIPDGYAGQAWDLMYDRSTYLYKNVGPFANDLFGFGKTFPHPYGQVAQVPPLFYQKLIVSPAGDELTLEFALELLRQERLGLGATTDYLAISFSSTDLVGHTFSPSSLECEDNLLRLDRTLAKLFEAVDRSVGLSNTLIVLAGDHGVPQLPEYLKELGINTGRITEDQIKTVAAAALRRRYGRDDLILSYKHPYIYLNRKAILAAKLDEAEVERTAAAGAMALKGVFLGLPSAELGSGVSDSNLIEEIRRNQNPKRSGDVYVVQAPQWQVDEKPPSQETAVIEGHGSPWAYDTYVPIVFVAPGTHAAFVDRPVQTIDIAVTLATYFGTTLPSGSVGAPLIEVLNDKNRLAP